MLSRPLIFVGVMILCMLALAFAQDAVVERGTLRDHTAVPILAQLPHLSARRSHRLLSPLVACACAGHRFRVFTAGSLGPSNTSSRYNFTISGLYANGSFPSNADIQRYQIALWISVLLVVIVLSAVYSLAFMDFKKDTILYSSFNPNWEERKRR